ncbi:CU044_2847 family protein [Kitasatospora atroaurantiaca]|uniref:CU044_2847 family protein n=1 Tax=Kitasatospora atroaurantiaca TaxID=285545 RepID=UPI0011A82950|nr:CU044_2847 family protein [Kitasatospora atroaurantiaca]
MTVETIDLGDGTSVRAEVIGEVSFQPAGDEDEFGDVGVRDRAARLGSAVALTLDQVRDTVQGIGRWAAESIAQGAAAGSPDSFEVEFGLKLAVKSGQLMGIIAEAGSEAGLTVKLSWDLAARRERAGAGAAAGVEGRVPASVAAAE